MRTIICSLGRLGDCISIPICSRAVVPKLFCMWAQFPNYLKKGWVHIYFYKIGTNEYTLLCTMGKIHTIQTMRFFWKYTVLNLRTI